MGTRRFNKFSVLYYLHQILEEFVWHQSKFTDYGLPLQIFLFSLALWLDLSFSSVKSSLMYTPTSKSLQDLCSLSLPICRFNLNT